VWALGLILYAVLTGRSFWRAGDNEAATFAEVLREVLVEPIPDPSARARQQGATFPARLAPIFRRCVVRTVKSRFPDAKALWEALDGALCPDVPLELAATAAAPPRPLALEDTALAPAPSRPRAAPVVESEPERTVVVPTWLLGVLLAVVVVVGGGLAARRLMRGEEYVASCRLCTVAHEGKTYANGPIALGQVRHTIEAQFPRMEAACIGGGDKAGQVFLRFRLREGKGLRGVQDMRYTPESGVNRCIADMITKIPFEEFGGVQLNGGTTDVAYVLEYDPNFAR
jgi:hypothetical protein